MIEIPVADAPDQVLSAILDGRRCTFRLRYSQSVDRWSFDLSIDDQPVLHGRRIVVGNDLWGGLALGLGYLFAIAAKEGAEPGRDQLPNGLVRLYHVTETDVATLSA